MQEEELEVSSVSSDDTDNIDTTKLDDEWVLENLHTFTGIAKKLLRGMPPAQAAQQLQAHFRKTAKSLLECGNCGAECDGDLCEVCPFCVEEEEEAETEEEEAETEIDESEDAEEEETEAESKPEEEEEGPEVTVTDKPRGRKKKASKKVAKKKTAKMKPSSKTNGKSEVVAPVTEPVTELVGEGHLDEAVATVKGLVAGIYENAWQIGQELSRIKENRLWTARLDKRGKPKYKDFGSFVTAEFEQTPQWSNSMIRIASGFKPEDAREISISKLNQIVKLKPQDRDALLEKARAGATVSEIAAEVAANPNKADPKPGFRGKAGTENRSGRPAKAKPVKETVSTKADPKKSDELTIALAKARFKVPLFIKGTERRAKQVSTEPVGEYQTSDGVMLSFELRKDKANQLELVVKAKR